MQDFIHIYSKIQIYLIFVNIYAKLLAKREKLCYDCIIENEINFLR